MVCIGSPRRPKARFHSSVSPPLPRHADRVIYSPAHGDMAFTVPLFDQFMLRAMPRMD